MYLMWWWQSFLRYFKFSSLLHVQWAYFNRLNIHLVWVCHVRGEVPPRTFFPLSPNDETCKVDHLSHVSLLGLLSVLGQVPRPNTLFWAIVPTAWIVNFDYLEEKKWQISSSKFFLFFEFIYLFYFIFW